MASATKIKVRVRGGKKGGLVVVERVPLTAIKNRQTKINFGGEVIPVHLTRKARIWTPLAS